jgi:serralysin
MCFACVAQGISTSSAAFDHGLSAASVGSDDWADATGLAVGAAGIRNVDALLFGTKWSGTISYSFPNARGDYEVPYAEADMGLSAVSFNQQQAARYILEGFSSVAGGPVMALTSVEQFTNASLVDAGSNGADIRIATSPSANPTAYAYLPSSSYYGGDVWFGTSYDYSQAQVGNYQYATVMHELGHALGLKHGHTAGGLGNVTLTADRDSLEFSVMTYHSYVGQTLPGYTNETYGFAQTFMMYDIAALQHLYGADFSANAGNTVYKWSTTTGETFVNGTGQGAPGGGATNRIFLTIWDGGGIDTYDCSNYTSNLRIDLTPGGWSKMSDAQSAYLGGGNYARGNVFNALQYYGDARSLVENVIGGTGADRIVGNIASNALNGERGNDHLLGGAGNDMLEGGAGSDMVDGGAGTDKAVFSGSRSDYRIAYRQDGSIEVADGRRGTPDGTDLLFGIEELQFKNGILNYHGQWRPSTSLIEGTSRHETLLAFSGNDNVFGYAGNDRLYGLAGQDSISGGSGNDLIRGGLDIDYLVGGGGADRFEYAFTSESRGATRDVILDFNRAHGDKIDVRAIDANMDLGGNQNFTFIGNNAFSGAGGELRYANINGQMVVQGNTDADGAVEFEIRFNGMVPTQSADFIL